MEESLRSIVAVRPEAIVLSSVPDRATAMLAAQLAGSVLVIAETPATTSAQAVTGLLQMGVPAQLLAGALAAITSQRHVRQVCRICRQQIEAPAPQTLAHHGIGPEEAQTLKFFRGVGCPSCNKVGYRGRRAIFEVMGGSPEVRAGVLSGVTASDIEAIAVGSGMITLRERCLELVREGATTFDEFTRLRL
jgi:type IV pilus assembly protein PilB